MTTLGAVFLPYLPPERLRSVARAADEAGLDELWLWEDCFWESGIATASAALAWTERLRVGVGLLPVPLRNVALTAMEAATLHRLFPGRVDIAVGHGVQDWMAQVGARVESPMTLLREYTIALRALLRGEEVSTQGRYVRLDKVALAWPPDHAPAVYMGAVGPRTLRLAGETADGTILTGGTPPDAVRRARALIDDGRPDGVPHRVVVYLHAATGPGAAERMATERRRWRDPEGADVSGTRDAGGAGGAGRPWGAAGADAVILQPTSDDPDPEGFMRFVAREVSPLV
ncbi:LLM class flavin-dependent oxidoreductase [Micromonospora sp. CPCC 205371]|nr:LLM class flavin-dependent oxidoreductase [Micromonospora sp. CPCC 205371]